MVNDWIFTYCADVNTCVPTWLKLHRLSFKNIGTNRTTSKMLIIEILIWCFKKTCRNYAISGFFKCCGAIFATKEEDFIFRWSVFWCLIILHVVGEDDGISFLHAVFLAKKAYLFSLRDLYVLAGFDYG